jgi:hypothetical protein
MICLLIFHLVLLWVVGVPDSQVADAVTLPLSTVKGDNKFCFIPGVVDCLYWTTNSFVIAVPRGPFRSVKSAYPSPTTTSFKCSGSESVTIVPLDEEGKDATLPVILEPGSLILTPVRI